MKSPMFVLPALVAIVLFSSPSHAGRVDADTATCSRAVLFGGETIHGCMGTMKGFRDSPDPEAYAELVYRANGVVSFQARIDGVFFLCVFEHGYDAQYFASVAGNLQNTRFVIGSRDGRCDMLGATLSIGSRWGWY